MIDWCHTNPISVSLPYRNNPHEGLGAQRQPHGAELHPLQPVDKNDKNKNLELDEELEHFMYGDTKKECMFKQFVLIPCICMLVEL